MKGWDFPLYPGIWRETNVATAGSILQEFFKRQPLDIQQKKLKGLPKRILWEKNLSPKIFLQTIVIIFTGAGHGSREK